MTLLVTVPHRCLVGIRDPGCDLNADVYAKELVRLVSGHIRTSLILGDTPRKACDLNRKSCRNTGMRALLTEALGDPGISTLLDVHTFTYGKFPILGGEKLWLVVMNGDRSSSAWKLLLCLRRYGFGDRVAFAHCPQVDIVRQASAAGIPAALLEIRDDLADLPEYGSVMRGVARAVYAWAYMNGGGYMRGG